MKFKQKEGVVFRFGEETESMPMPEPKVGKVYHGFDDGKIRLSRLIDWKILERIDLDNDTVDSELLDQLQQEIIECYWIFNPEQTIIFRAQALHGNGKPDEDIGECYFIRTLSGGWFGALSAPFFWCELDVDNRWYDVLIEEEE